MLFGVVVIEREQKKNAKLVIKGVVPENTYTHSSRISGEGSVGASNKYPLLGCGEAILYFSFNIVF